MKSDRAKNLFPIDDHNEEVVVPTGMIFCQRDGNLRLVIGNWAAKVMPWLIQTFSFQGRICPGVCTFVF